MWEKTHTKSAHQGLALNQLREVALEYKMLPLQITPLTIHWRSDTILTRLDILSPSSSRNFPNVEKSP